jgi:hypothetical protein
MKAFLTILLFSLFLCSCRNVSFIPAYQNVPIFTDKKQIRVEPSISNMGIDAGFAAAPVNHLGCMLNIHGTINTFGIEPGLGGFVYFHPLVLETYAGYAFVQKKYYSSGLFGDSTAISMKANRFFVQPSIGFHFNDYFELAVSARLSDWEFMEYDYKHETIFLMESEKHLKSLHRLLVEPAFTIKAGGDRIKAFFQTGIYYDPYGENESPDIYETNITPWFFRLGCNMSVNLPHERRTSHDNVRYF